MRMGQSATDLLQDANTRLQPRGVLGKPGIEGDAPDVFHDEEQFALGRRSGIEQLRDPRMAHASQRLALHLETQAMLGVRGAPAHDLDRDLSRHRAGLLREEHATHAALAKLAQQQEAAETAAGEILSAGIGRPGQRFGEIDQFGGDVVVRRRGAHGAVTSSSARPMSCSLSFL